MLGPGLALPTCMSRLHTVIFVSATLVLVAGCDAAPEDLQTRPDGKADDTNSYGELLPNLTIHNRVGEVPGADDFSTAPSCLIFDDDAFKQANRTRDANQILITTERYIYVRKMGEQRDPLSVAQLRETLRYMTDPEVRIDVMDGAIGDGSLDFETLGFDELNAMGETARFGWLFDKQNNAQYNHVNIGLGSSNPYDLLFQHGTLYPVAALQDGSLTYCDPSLNATSQ